MNGPVSLRITPLGVANAAESLTRASAQWAPFWRTGHRTARILTVVHGISFAPFREELLRAAEAVAPLHKAGDPAGWRWPWLLDQCMMLDEMESMAQLLGIDHYFLVWPENQMQRETLAESVRASFGLPAVAEQPLPMLLSAPQYREHPTYLEPTAPGYPLLAVLTAYHVDGAWDPASWAPLLYGDVPLSLCIDVTTVGRNRAKTWFTTTANQLKVAATGSDTDVDNRTNQEAAIAALESLRRDQLHMLAYAVLIPGRTVRDLERRVAIVTDMLAARLRGGTVEVERLIGRQWQHAQLFTTRSSGGITPLVRRNTLSHLVARKLPWLIAKTTPPRGVCWGIGATGLPLMRRIEQEAQGNINGIVVGMTGSGKTTSTLALLLRLASAPEEPFHVCYIDPLGKGEMLTAAAGRGARFFPVARDATINILDPVATDLGLQLETVRRKLGMILGRPVQDGDRTRVEPRPFSMSEVAGLDLACEEIYGPDGSRLPALLTQLAAGGPVPILEDLFRALGTVWGRKVTEIRELRREIELLLMTSEGKRLWNQPTTLRWDFSADVTAYSFQEVPESRLPIYYAAIFDGLRHYIRHRPKDRRFLACIDEYYYMRVVRELGEYVRRMVKTMRNDRAGMILMDQNLGTWFDAEGAAGAGQMQADNAHYIALYRLQGREAELAATIYGDRLTDEHLQALRIAEEGRSITLFGNQVEDTMLTLTAAEQAAFRVRAPQPPAANADAARVVVTPAAQEVDDGRRMVEPPQDGRPVERADAAGTAGDAAGAAGPPPRAVGPADPGAAAPVRRAAASRRRTGTDAGGPGGDAGPDRQPAGSAGPGAGAAGGKRRRQRRSAVSEGDTA